MTIPANLYADKIFAEQPTALWSLDDTISGVTPQNISSKNIAISSTYGIEAASYGADIFPGYYLTANASANSLFVKDNGIPMVYGASNITHVYKNTDKPSIILPGFGFLNSIGKNQTFTFEMWVKINNTSSIPRRIIGPISSTDGIYVHNSFITIKVGKYKGSYSVGEWGKPTLVNFIYEPSEISLLINGEQVISIPINNEEIVFPDKYSDTDKDQDWIGVYAYDDVFPLSVDCTAIYPYKVSSQIAKRRWVYGQAVQSPEIESFTDNDTPIIADYQFSKYGKSYLYPDVGKWIQGSFDNLLFDDERIILPTYKLPSFISEGAITIDEWYTKQDIGSAEVDNLASNNLYFKMITEESDSTNSTVENVSSAYFNFGNMSTIINEQITSFYGVFEASNTTAYGSLTSLKETLFKIENSNGSNLEIYLNNPNTAASEYTLNYSFTDSANVTTSLFSSTVSFSSPSFVAGVSVPNIVSSSSVIKDFFADPQALTFYLGGNKDLSTSFLGKIKRVGFSNQKNFTDISEFYNSNGIVDKTEVTTFLNYYSTYTLIPTNFMSEFKLDIATNSYWKDYVPLSYFAKNVLDENQVEYQDLDFLQFMIDYPESDKYITASAIEDYEIDTSKSLVKTYVYFSRVPATANEAVFDSTLTEVPLKYGKVVIPESGVWDTKKYEVVNNSIIYKPQDENFKNLFINFYLELKVYGIFNNPVSIKSLRIGSKSLNQNSENEIGTKLGKNIFPYKIVDGQKDYKAINPISVYTGNTPYLYLTKYSGFRLMNSDFSGSRGIEVRLNESSFDYYKVSALQFSFMSNDLFLEDDTEILRVYEGEGLDYYKLYATRADSSGKTASLYAVSVNATTLVETTLTKDSVLIYVDGKTSDLDQPTDRILGVKEWHMIGVKFINFINLSGKTSGSIRFTGPFWINNINSYRINQREEGDRVFYNHWSDVYSLYANWGYVNDSTWANVSVDVKSAIAGVDPSSLYNVYLGNNRLIVDATEMPLVTEGYQYSVYKDVNWTTASVKVV